MWVMPSSSARCAQLPRAADKVPFYAALKKFRDYLNGLVPEYDENEYVFNDPKYSQISTEAELKEEAIAFTALEAGEVVVMADPNKKKRGRPKKIRGENGEEIPTPKQQRNKNNESLNTEGIEDDPGKKKRGRPKKVKDSTQTQATPKKKASSKQSKDQMIDSNSPHLLTPPTSVPPQGIDMNSMQHINGIQHQQHSGMLSNGAANNRPFLPPMESPTANNYNNGAISQQNHMQPLNHQQSQNASPVNLCFPPTNHEQVVQPEISPHHQQTYQQRQTPTVHQQQIFGVNVSSSAPEIPSDIGTNMNPEHMTPPVNQSTSLGPQSEFEQPQSAVRNPNEVNIYAQMQPSNALEQQQQQQHQTQHQTHSPSSQAQSPMGSHYPHQQHNQPQLSHMISNISNGSPYSPYARQHVQQVHPNQQQPHHHQPQQQPSYTNHQQQSPHHHAHQNTNVNTKQINQHHNGNTTPAVVDPFKDVATKSLSGLESLVDQIPNLNEQEAGIGSMPHTVTSHNGNTDVLCSSSSLINVIHNLAFETQAGDTFSNFFSGYSSSGTPNLATTSPAVASSSSLLPPLGPPHHHSHYPYTSHAAVAASQSPYAANPFSVSSLTSSTYPSAAVAMNSYHQNLMNSSHLTSSFMEPPHMPVPVTPLYHSYQQQGYPGYAPPHPSAIHMSNYPYYTNTGYTQAPGSSYHHSMFDRINF
jgi:thymine-DNA glycosylase